MKDGKAEKAIRDKIDAAGEAPVQDDQRDIGIAGAGAGNGLTQVRQ